MPATLLADALRINLELTGTRIGCDTSQCGSCTVHVDGRAVKSCTLLAVQAGRASALRCWRNSFPRCSGRTILRAS